MSRCPRFALALAVALTLAPAGVEAQELAADVALERAPGSAPAVRDGSATSSAPAGDGDSPASQPSTLPAPAPPRAVASPAAEAAPERTRLLIMDLKAIEVEPGTATILTGLVTDAVARYPTVQTISSEDIKQLIELESGKQQLGCDTSSCLVEIAGAMGARYVLFGSVGRVGELYIMQLNLFDAAQARAVARRSVRAEAEEGLVHEVDATVDALLQPLVPKAQAVAAAAPAAEAEPSGRGYGWMVWTGAIAGGAGLVGFGLVHTISLIIAGNAGATGKMLETMTIPVAGPMLVAGEVFQQSTDPANETPEGAGATLTAVAVGEGVTALAAVAGAGLFTSGLALERDLGAPAQAWHWGFLALGVGLLGGGLALDLAPESSRNERLDPVDFAPLVLYGAGVASAAVGLFANPLEEE